MNNRNNRKLKLKYYKIFEAYHFEGAHVTESPIFPLWIYETVIHLLACS